MSKKFLNVIKPEVRALAAYRLAPERSAVKLNQNENPWGPSEIIKQEIWRQIYQRQWSRYPDFTPATLREKLARHVGWQVDGILVGNGSNEMIQAVLAAIVSPGVKVMISQPTFAVYKQVATINGARVIDVQLTSDLKLDVPKILFTIESEQPEVIFVCSPNNPTGGMIDKKDLRKILAAAPGIVVVDEAYHEFSGYTAVPLLTKFENLVILHTFSKAIGMAGLRIGYLMTSPDVAREIDKVILPYNLNLFSRIAAETALELYETEVKPQISLILKERDRVFDKLREITGVNPLPTTANFILCRLALEPKFVFEKLKENNLLVRDVSAMPALKDCLRFSIGTPEENDRLLAAMREIFSSAPGQETENKRRK